MSTFPFYQQLDANDCGPSCLHMISKHYGRALNLSLLKSKSYISKDGVSLLGISEAAEFVGYRTEGYWINIDQLKDDAVFPCIVYWNQEHFVVVYKINNKKVFVADPAHGKIIYTHKEFLKHWISTKVNGEL